LLYQKQLVSLKKELDKPLKIVQKKKKKEKLTKKQRRRKLKEYIEKSGFELNLEVLKKRFFNIALIVSFAAALIFIIYGSVINLFSAAYLIIITLSIFVLGFPLMYVLFWALFFAFVDMRIFRRKTEMEDVLADFLQLTSANIRAGMPIDRALWYAVRPKFGVLAKEIEDVAKETMSGKDLKEALHLLADKYDSDILKRTVSLLTEGLNAGGEIGGLLNKISLDIEEIKNMKKEMAASIMTYVIFIGFASIMAAPLLFALSNQLIIVVNTITGSFGTASIPSNFGIGFGGSSVSSSDFKFFAIVSLTLTSIFSGMIISMIQKGNIKQGLKYIPMFIAATIALFFFFNMALGSFMSVFF
jgi:flagellar protein FlaJ